MARLHLLACALVVALAACNAAPRADDATTAAPSTAAPDTEAPTDAPTDAPSPTTTTAAPTRPAPTTVDPQCAALPCPSKKAGRVPDRCNCQRYFECSKKGELTPAKCKPWQNFDHDTLTCRFIDQVDCGWLKPTTPAPTTPPPTTRAPPVPGCPFVPECPASGSTKQGIPCADSCSSYIQCEDGRWDKKDCSFFQHFDSKSNSCVWRGYTCAA